MNKACRSKLADIYEKNYHRDREEKGKEKSEEF